MVAAVDDVFSWKHFHVTASLQCGVVLHDQLPSTDHPGDTVTDRVIPCAIFWTRKKRAFDQIAMDFDVSVGKLPPHLDILLNGDSLTNEEIKAREARAEGARSRRRRWSSRFAPEGEAAAKQRRDEAESAEAVAAILAEADAESDEDSDEEEAQAPKMAGSMNPFTNLMRQYEELTTMIASIQTIDGRRRDGRRADPRRADVEANPGHVRRDGALVGTGLAFFASQFVVEWSMFVVWLVGKKAVGATSGGLPRTECRRASSKGRRFHLRR